MCVINLNVEAMKSEYAQKFNHDPIADGYDQDVNNENNPIRKGYKDLLYWVQEKTKEAKHIVDLGCGTGNTTLALKNPEKVVCVDISENMIELAKKKLSNIRNVDFAVNDLLDYFSTPKNVEQIDTVISTYAIHHLTQVEKHQLFQQVYNVLPKNGIVAFGDLMFESKVGEQLMKEKYPDLVEDFDDELYWYVDEESQAMKNLGFSVEIKRFSDLSWGLFGKKVM